MNMELTPHVIVYERPLSLQMHTAWEDIEQLLDHIHDQVGGSVQIQHDGDSEEGEHR